MRSPRTAVERAVRGLFERPDRVRLEPMAGDASTREFWRVTSGDGPSHVVMDYGAPFEGTTDDVAMSAVFRTAGLPVAAIRHVAPDPGFLVLEDLGRTTLETLVEREGNDAPTVATAYDRIGTMLLRMADRGTQALAESGRARGPRLDAARFRFEMKFFAEHFLGAWADVRVSSRLSARLDALADEAADGPGDSVLCHRDLHSRNVVMRDDGRPALVDIQDAQWGPNTYDLASLLVDAYVDVAPPVASRLFDDVRSTLAQPTGPAAFEARLQVTKLERAVKALGTFGYQFAVLGRARYRSAARRTIEHVRSLETVLPEYGAVFDAVRSAASRIGRS